MIYIRELELPDGDREADFFYTEQRTIFTSCYPFKIFPYKELDKVTFKDITIFYGSNGSGKTTLLNVIAEKVKAVRHSEYNTSPLFEGYVDMCDCKYRRGVDVHFMTSDDVFDYILNVRYMNKGIDGYREQLEEDFYNLRASVNDEDGRHLHGLEDYERWKDTWDAARYSQSKFIKKRAARRIDSFSNGETAFKYFIDRIDKDAVYILDEPENSLSPSRQIELKEYIEASVRAYDCQFIISTHSPILLALNKACIYDLDSSPASIKKWSELENVRAYFDFFMREKDKFE